jgi:AcrR family transcriptional regulator
MTTAVRDTRNGSVRDTRNKGITRDGVAVAAAALVEEVGVERLSMRQVAARLGVSPMALYNHVENKEGLLDLVATHLRAQIVVDESLPAVEQLVSLLLQLCELGAQHPRLLENPLALVGDGPEALDLPLRMLHLLAEMGLDPAQVRTTYNTLTFVVTGAAAVRRTVRTRSQVSTLRGRERGLLAAAAPADKDLVSAMLALPRTTIEEQLRYAITTALGR